MITEEKVILLVEDNPDDEALAIRALRKNNIKNEIVVARDGVEAIDYLEGDGRKPCLILLDIKLPRKNGFDVLAQVRGGAKTRMIPVVILTSSREEDDLARGYSLGANSYIRKPVDFKQFTEAVRQLGLYWLGINEPPPGSH
jgi:CheY-like chemotaxis protein